MLSDQGKEMKVMKNKYAENKQKFKTLTKMMKIRNERTLGNGPCNKTCPLYERKFTNNFTTGNI